MERLIANFGLDWKLLLSQVVNFAILVAILKFAVYKPLIRIIKERQKKIEVGLERAEEAEKRLSEISEIQKEKTKEAENKGLLIMQSAEKRAKEEEKKMLIQAEEKARGIRKEALQRIEGEKFEALENVKREAVALVKEILVRTVSLSPEAVDEALIRKAAESLQEAKK